MPIQWVNLTMGTIIGRTRKDGSWAFTAQIVIKKDGAIVHREAQTFDRRPADFTLGKDALLRSLPYDVVYRTYLRSGVSVFQFIRRNGADNPLLAAPSQIWRRRCLDVRGQGLCSLIDRPRPKVCIHSLDCRFAFLRGDLVHIVGSELRNVGSEDHE